MEDGKWHFTAHSFASDAAILITALRIVSQDQRY